MTTIIRRRRKALIEAASVANQQPGLPLTWGESPPEVLIRFGCTDCFESFYAIDADTCPTCEGEAQEIPAYGPVPGKFTKVAANNVVITARLPEALATRLDEVRGSTPRSEWIRNLIEDTVAVAPWTLTLL